MYVILFSPVKDVVNDVFFSDDTPVFPLFACHKAAFFFGRAVNAGPFVGDLFFVFKLEIMFWCG